VSGGGQFTSSSIGSHLAAPTGKWVMVRGYCVLYSGYWMPGSGYWVYANFLILTFRSQGGRGPFPCEGSGGSPKNSISVLPCLSWLLLLNVPWSTNPDQMNIKRCPDGLLKSCGYVNRHSWTFGRGAGTWYCSWSWSWSPSPSGQIPTVPHPPPPPLFFLFHSLCGIVMLRLRRVKGSELLAINCALIWQWRHRKALNFCTEGTRVANENATWAGNGPTSWEMARRDTGNMEVNEWDVIS